MPTCCRLLFIGLVDFFNLILIGIFGCLAGNAAPSGRQVVRAAVLTANLGGEDAVGEGNEFLVGLGRLWSVGVAGNGGHQPLDGVLVG